MWIAIAAITGTLAVVACALHGDRGAYQITLHAGSPEPVTEDEILADVQRLLARVESGELDAEVIARRLAGLAYGLYTQGRYRTARAAGHTENGVLARV